MRGREGKYRREGEREEAGTRLSKEGVRGRGGKYRREGVMTGDEERWEGGWVGRAGDGEWVGF